MKETLVWFLGGRICWRRDRLPTPVFLGFPCGSTGKESTRNVGDLGCRQILYQLSHKGSPLSCPNYFSKPPIIMALHCLSETSKQTRESLAWLSRSGSRLLSWQGFPHSFRAPCVPTKTNSTLFLETYHALSHPRSQFMPPHFLGILFCSHLTILAWENPTWLSMFRPMPSLPQSHDQFSPSSRQN